MGKLKNILKTELMPANFGSMESEISELKQDFNTSQQNSLESDIKFIESHSFDFLEKQKNDNLSDATRQKMEQKENKMRFKLAETALREAKDKIVAINKNSEMQAWLIMAQVDLAQSRDYEKAVELLDKEISRAQALNDKDAEAILNKVKDSYTQAQRAIDNAKISTNKIGKTSTKSITRINEFQKQQNKILHKNKKVLEGVKLGTKAMGQDYNTALQKAKSGQGSVLTINTSKVKKREVLSTIDSKAENISKESVANAVARSLELDLSSAQKSAIATLSKAGTSIKDSSKQAALQDMAGKTLTLDFETLMGKGNEPGEGVTVGFTTVDDNGNLNREEGLIVTGEVEKDLARIMTMLTDPSQMEEAQKSLARQIGLGEGEKNSTTGKITYKDKNGHVLSENELKLLLTNVFINKLSNGQNFASIGKGDYTIAPGVVIHIPEDYSVINGAGIAEKTEQYKDKEIYIANKGFDTKVHNAVVPKGKQLDVDKINDIFDMFFGDEKDSLKYAGGYGVEALMRVLDPAFDAIEEKKAHGAGYDSWLETKLVQLIKAAKLEGRDLGSEFKNVEKIYEDLFQKMVGGKMYEDAVDENGQHYQRRTQAFTDFHKVAAEQISKVIQSNPDLRTGATNFDISKIYETDTFDAQQIQADYEKMQRNANSAKTVQTDIVTAIKALEDSGKIRAGYSDFLSGKITAEKMHELNPNRSKKEFEGQNKLLQQLGGIAQLAAQNGIITQFDIEQDSRGVVSIIPKFIDASKFKEGVKYQEGDEGWIGKATAFRLLDGNSEIVPGIVSGNVINPYTNTGVDAVIAENDSKVFGLERLFKTNPELRKDGERIQGIEKIVNGYAKQYSPLTTAKNDDVSVTVEDVDGTSFVSDAQVMSEEEKTKEKHIFNWANWINHELSHNRKLAEEYLNSVSNNKDDVNIELAKLRELESAEMGSAMLLFNRIINSTDEELQFQAQELIKTNENYRTSLDYMITCSDNFATLREKARAMANNIGGFHIENLSENEIRAGKATNINIDTHKVSATMGIPNEASEKSRPDKVYDKAFSSAEQFLNNVEGADKFWNTNYFEPINSDTGNNTEARLLVTKKGYLPKDFIKDVVNDKTEGNVGFTEDHALVSEDWLSTNAGKGADKFSAALTDEEVAVLEGLTNQQDLFDNEAIDQWIPLSHSIVVGQTFKLGNNVIPEGSIITAVRVNQNGERQFQYRQGSKATADDKFVGDESRKQYQSVGFKTVEEQKQFMLSKVPGFLRKKYKFGLQGKAKNVKEIATSGAGIIGVDGSLDKDSFRRWKSAHPESSLTFEALEQEMKVLEGVINSNDVFEVAQEADEKLEPRKSASFGIPVLRGLIGNPNERMAGKANTRFDYLKSQNDILNDFFEVVNGQVITKYNHDLSNYNVNDKYRQKFINSDIQNSQLSDILDFDIKTGANYKITNDDEIARITGNAFKSLQEVKDYVEKYYNNVKQHDGMVKSFINGYIKSTDNDWGLMADLARSLTNDEAQRLVLLNSGLAIMDTRADYNFTDSYGAEGTPGESMEGKVNEHAGVKSQWALLNREYERMYSQRDTALKILMNKGLSEEEAEKKFEEIVQNHLNNIVTVNKRRAEEFDVLNVAARSNDARYRDKEANKRTITIGFTKGKTTNGDYISFDELNEKEKASHPKNDTAFTQEEYENSMFKLLYGDGRDKLIGDRSVRVKFDFSTLDKDSKEYQRLKDAGIDDSVFIALEKEQAELGKDKTRPYMEQQREFTRKVKYINDIMSGDRTPGSEAGDEWKNEIITSAKSKRKSVFDAPQQSAILHSGIAGENWDYSWVNEKTARNIIKYKEDGSKSDYIKYIMSFADNESGVFDTFASQKLNINKNNFSTKEEYQKAVQDKLNSKSMKFKNIKRYANDDIYEAYINDMRQDYEFSKTHDDKQDLLGYINQFSTDDSGFKDIYQAWLDKYFEGDANNINSLNPEDLKKMVFKLSQGIVAKKFNTLASRGPFLTEYSNSLNEIAINFDDTGHDDVINMTEEDYTNWKADWDGDILNLTRLREEADEVTREVIDALIEERRAILRQALVLEKKIKSNRKNNRLKRFMDHIDEYANSSAFKDQYQNWFDSLSDEKKQAWNDRDISKFSKDELFNINKIINPNEKETNIMHAWMGNASLLTDKDSARSLYELMLNGKRGVGLANYKDEQLRAAFMYRTLNDTDIAPQDILAMKLFSEYDTQLGQQTGISTKKFIEVFNDAENWSDGKFVLNNRTAEEIYNSMLDTGYAKKHGIGSAEDVIKNFEGVIKGSLFSHFSINHLQEAKSNAGALRSAGFEDEAYQLEEDVKELETIFENEDVLGMFKWLEKTGNIGDALDFISDKGNSTKIQDFIDKRYSKVVGTWGYNIPGELTINKDEAIANKFDKDKDGKVTGNAECDFNLFKPYLENYQYYFEIIIDRLNNIANNGGMGGKGDGAYGSNILWEKYFKDFKKAIDEDGAKVKSSYFKTELKTDINSDTGLPNHDYTNTKDAITASQFGSKAKGLPGDALLTQQQNDIQRSIYTNWNQVDFTKKLDSVVAQGGSEVFDLAQIPNLDIDKIDEEGNINNKALNLLVSSLMGNLLHAAHASIITEIKDGKLTLSEAIANEDITKDIYTNGNNEYAQEYRKTYLALFRALGGNQERVNAVMKKYGDVNKNLALALSEEQKNGLLEGAENIAVEKSFGARLTYEDKNGNVLDAFDLVGTMDTVNLLNVKKDENSNGKIDWRKNDWFKDFSLGSIDLKNKLTTGNISDSDAAEGLVHQELLWAYANASENEAEIKRMVENSLAAQYQNFDKKKFDSKWPKIFEAIKANIPKDRTAFLASKGGQAALIKAGLLVEGEAIPTTPEDIEKLMMGLLKFMAKNQENGLGNKGVNIRSASSIESQSGELYSIKDYDEAVERRGKLTKDLLTLEKQQEALQKSNSPEAQGLYGENAQRITEIEAKIAKYDALVDKLYLEREGFMTEEQRQDYEALKTDFNVKRFLDKDNPEGTNSGLYGGMYGNAGGMYGGMGGIGGMTGGFYQLTNAARGALAGIMGFTAANKVLAEVTKSIKTVITAAEQLDKKLVDLQIATGNTKSETISMLKSYNKLASELGRTTTSVAEAANDWLRAGYEGQEATDLITASMYLSTLGMMDAATATKDLISVLKGWKLQSEDIMSVVDKLVTVIDTAYIW